MKMHNPVLLDFIEYKVDISHKGKRVELKGIYNQGELKNMCTTGVKQLLKKGQAIWAHMFTLSAAEVDQEEVVPVTINNIIKQYLDVFEEPKTPLSSKQQDHFIPLKSDAASVNIRPYMYSYF